MPLFTSEINFQDSTGKSKSSRYRINAPSVERVIDESFERVRKRKNFLKVTSGHVATA